MGTLGEVRRRPVGGREGHGEGVVGKRREERKRMKEQPVEGEDEVAVVELKVKRTKRRVADEDDGSGGGRSKKAKPAKRREHIVGKKPGKNDNQSVKLQNKMTRVKCVLAMTYEYHSFG